MELLTTKSDALVNYNFEQLSSGIGYNTFYGFDYSSAYYLSSERVYSANIYTQFTANDPGDLDWTTFGDYDFNLLLNKPLVIKGSLIVNVSYYAAESATNAATSIRTTVYVRKYNGSTETDIANATSGTLSVAHNTYGLTTTIVTIPQTNLKLGEYLRLTIVSQYDPDDNKNYTIRVAHDPAGRTATWDTTGAVPSTMIFHLPTKISL